MVKGFYLVSVPKNDEELKNKLMEVETFKKLFDDIEMDLMFFEDIIPIVTNESNGKILLTDGSEIDCPDFVNVRAFDLGDKQYHLNAVLEMFEGLGVLCINSAKTKAITSDKLLTMQIARSVCDYIKIPKTMLLTPEINAAKVGEIIGFPVVIKVLHGSKGKGISFIETEDELDNLLNMIFAAPFNDQIIAQEAILSSKGRDLRLILGFGRLIDNFQRVNEGEFVSNIAAGGHVESQDIPDALVEDALKLADAIDLKLGSIDFLYGENDDEFYFCEANSTVGLTSRLNHLDKFRALKDVFSQFEK